MSIYSFNGVLSILNLGIWNNDLLTRNSFLAGGFKHGLFSTIERRWSSPINCPMIAGSTANQRYPEEIPISPLWLEIVLVLPIRYL